eukprot:scaffold318_cov110-Cylindrotheca_fusiformis.AAC.11
MFQVLLQFKEQEGHHRVPNGHQENGDVNLGNWVRTQQCLYRASKFDDEHQNRLEAAGVVAGSWTYAKVGHA